MAWLSDFPSKKRSTLHKSRLEAAHVLFHLVFNPMKNLITCLVLIGSVFLSGCSTPLIDIPKMTDPNLKDPMAVISTKDEFTKTTKYEGRKLYLPNTNRTDYVLLRAWGQGLEIEATQFYVLLYSSSSKGWAFYETAYDDSGERLDVTKIAREVTRNMGGMTEEHLGINITRQQLEVLSRKGLRFKLIGKRAERIIEVPADYISNFLSKLPQSSENSG